MIPQKRYMLLCLGMFCLLVMPGAAVINVISAGNTVFVGEEGLDVSVAVPAGYHQIAWFSPGSDPSTEAPSQIQTIGNLFNFYISPSVFTSFTGPWYSWNGTTGPIAFYVQIPSVSIRTFDQNAPSGVNAATIPEGDYANFRIDTNLDVITFRSGYNPATDGIFTVKVTDPVGATYTYLVGANNVQHPLTNLNVNTSLWYWVPRGVMDGWNTGARIAGSRLYSLGTYTITVEYNANFLQDNDRGVMGIPSAPQNSLILMSGGALVLTGPSVSVTRGNPFVTTIHGAPDTPYYIWVKGTSAMTGNTGDQPPLITLGQSGVAFDTVGGPYTIGSYQFSGGSGTSIRDDVPPVPFDGTRYYAQVTTDSDGTGVVEWSTSDATDARSYDIHVERQSATTLVSNDVNVQIVEGSVSIGTTPPPIVTYLGEEIDISGTNTASDTTYLFITGPNLPSVGGRLDSPFTPVVDEDSSSFTKTSVLSNNSWQYRWQTTDLGIDAGAYTVYAESAPRSLDNVGSTQFSTTSVTLSAPLISSANISSTIAQGDILDITGTATGTTQLAAWLFGINEFMYNTISVNSNATYSYELGGGITADLAPGQYYVIIQHPGPDNTFEVYPNPSMTAVIGTPPASGIVLFYVAGANRLEGSDAAQALITALNSPNIDDTYTSRTFLVEPAEINITPIVTVTVGMPLVIGGTTDLAVSDQLQVQVQSSQFGPTPKQQGSGFVGASGTVTVQAGSGGVNTWSFTVDTSTLPPDQYFVIVSGVEVSVTSSTKFNLTNATPTTTTPIPPTTTPATTVPTTTTVIPTTTTPGFGIIIGLIGLAGAAFLLQRGR
jgi:PGF-CTERM protein